MAKISNLTRVQAFERSALLQIQHYDIHLDLTQGEKTFRSTTTVTFTADTTRGTSTFIDLFAEKIHSATLNGTALDISDFDTATGLELSNLQAENTLIVDAQMWYSHTGEGLHRFVDPVDQRVYLYTQFEPSDADRVFACFDQPNLKATFTLHITAPEDWEIICNTPVESTNDLTRHFTQTAIQSTYLIAIIAGPYASFYDDYKDEHGTIPLGIYARQSLASYVDAEKIFTETKQGFSFYHKNFGLPYPFGKYDQIFAPDFNAGAMENIGAVTFLEDYIFRSRMTEYRYERRCETILHEMAHMWFGDLVTMTWFEDLWLNESFATFASVLSQAEATEYSEAWTTFAAIEKAWAYQQDALSSTHPIAADIPDIHAVEVNFDGITYAKGASVLKQLVALVGLEEFLAGLRAYFKQYQYSNANFDDLLDALQDASGKDLSSWGAQWLKTTGMNSLEAVYEVDTSGNYSSFAIKQGPAEPGKGELRTHKIAIGIYDDKGNGTISRTRQAELIISEAETPVPELIGTKAGLFVLPNDDDLTYAKMTLDPHTIHNLTDRLGDLPESLPQTLLWSAIWEATRDTHFKARDFIHLVINHAESIQVISVLEKVLTQGATALSSYADPVWVQSTGQAQWNTFLLTAAQTAKAGSDRQLAFFNAFLAAPISEPAQQEILETLLSGSPSQVTLQGLELDADLRWKIICALARAGKYDAAHINAAHAQDNTNSGARFAAMALASIPTTEAKEKTWNTLFHDTSISNLMARWICSGFDAPGQTELLIPYQAKFFDEIVNQWDNSPSSELSQTIAKFLYPQTVPNAESLARSKSLAEAPHTPAGLKRLLLEGRDVTQRIINNRTYDAQ